MLKLKKKDRKKLMSLITLEVFSQSRWTMKFINKFMLQGKKARIEKIILSCFYEFRQVFINAIPFLILFEYLSSQRPIFGFSRVRKSRVFKKIPVPISPKRQLILILTWFTSAIRAIKIGNLKQKLHKELKHIKIGAQKTALAQYKFFQEFRYQIISSRVNIRFRWQ